MKVNHRWEVLFLSAPVDLGFLTQPICMPNLISLEGLVFPEQSTENSNSLVSRVNSIIASLISISDIAEYTARAYTQNSQAILITLSIIGGFSSNAGIA